MQTDNTAQNIRILKDSVAPLQKRLAALDTLKETKTPEALIGIANCCQSPTQAIAEKCSVIISGLDSVQVSELIDFLLANANAGHRGKKVFSQLYALKSREVFRYIIAFASSADIDNAKRKLFATWLKDLSILEDYVRTMLHLPAEIGSGPSLLALALGKALRNIDESVIPITIRHIKSASPDVSLRGLGILEEIATRADVSQLLIGVWREADDEKVKSKATKTMLKLSGSVRIFKEALADHENARVRANALELLWGLQDNDMKETARLLAATHLRDVDNRTRANASRVLYELGDPRGIETLLSMLEDSDAHMRTSAAWVIGEVRETSAIPKLRELAEADVSALVVENARHAIEKMGTWTARVRERFLLLRDYMVDTAVSVSDHRFFETLDCLKGRDSAQLSELLQSIYQAAPILCAEMLAHLADITGEESALAFILAAGYAKDKHLRSKAALLVGRTCAEARVLQYFLTDTDARVQANAIEALTSCTDAFATQMLTNYLKSTDNRILANAAKALCQMGDLRGWRILQINLRHPEPAFRASCVWALGEVGDAATLKQLEPLTNDPDANVRKHVRLAVEKIRTRSRRSPNALFTKIRYVDVSYYPRIDCYVGVNSRERPVTGLLAENFRLTENNIPLPFKLSAQSQALSIALLMDYSLSMPLAHIQAMESAAERLLDELSPDDSVAVIKFSDRVSFEQPSTKHRAAIRKAIRSPHSDNAGGTGRRSDSGEEAELPDESADRLLFYDAIYTALQHQRYTNGLKMVIALTNGADSGSKVTVEHILGAAMSHNQTLYIIALGENPDAETLIYLAEATSGFSVSAKTPHLLEDIYVQIARTVHEHYVLTYQSHVLMLKGINVLGVEVNYGGAHSRDTISLPKIS